MNQLAYPSSEEARATFSAVESGRISLAEGPVQEIDGAHLHALAPSTHFLHEWREYRLTCRGATHLEMGSQTYKAVVEGLFIVQFENQIGLCRIQAFNSSGSVLDTLHVEVISPKLGSLNSSLSFLRSMLADLASERGAFAFMPRAPTSRTVQQVQRPPSLLVQYFFLLNNAGAIEEALHLVLRAPHRMLDDETEHVSVFDLTEIDADVVLQLVQGGADFDSSNVPTRLRAAPAGVWFRVPSESFDSAENQFVKAVARSMADACRDVIAASWLQNEADPAVRRRRETLAHLRDQLGQFVRAPMFDEVGPMNRIPSSSRVLQRRVGYRDLNVHWQGFLHAHDPVWQRMQHAIDLRDIATLYEYWVWFELCRRIEDAFEGERPSISSIPPSELGLPHGSRATFGGHGTLTFNATRRAYSGILLRPDYLWEPSIGRKVGFDAKFRLAKDAAPLEVEDCDTPKDPQVKAKVDDLVKMHAYRDAVPGLRCAVVLFPGNVADFRSVSGQQQPGIDVSDVLHGELDGIGAIPMMPVGVEW